MSDRTMIWVAQIENAETGEFEHLYNMAFADEGMAKQAVVDYWDGECEITVDWHDERDGLGERATWYVDGYELETRILQLELVG